MWPNNIMLKFLPIATLFIFCIIYIPSLQDSAQKTKERIRMALKKSKLYNYDWTKNPSYQKNLEEIIERGKLELQKK